MVRKMEKPLKMPRPWQLMVSCSLGQMPQVPLSDCDWTLFRTFTLKNNLATLVYQGSRQGLPAEYRNLPQLIELRLLSKMNRLQSQRHIQALAEMAAAFQQAKIPMLSFKGPLLSQELYGNPAVRNSCDLDILVDEGKLPEACRCLETMGFKAQPSPWEKTPKRRALRQRRDQEMHRVFRRDGVTVELHWRLCYRFALSFESLWASRRSFRLLGQEVYTLSSAENLCYLITHGAGHGYRQLRWLLEIHSLLEKEQVSLSDLYTQMKERGVAMLLLETLLLLYRLPGIPMPEKLDIPAGGITFQAAGENTLVEYPRKAAGDMGRAERLVKAVYPLLSRNNPEEGLDGRIYKRLLPTLGNRPPFLLSFFEPYTSELEWIDLPDRWFFLYYFLRPVHFLRGQWKKIRHNTLAAAGNGGRKL